jgi:hypothetical protein
VSGLQEEEDQGMHGTGVEERVADEMYSVIKLFLHVRIAQKPGSNVLVPRLDLFSFMQIR